MRRSRAAIVSAVVLLAGGCTGESGADSGSLSNTVKIGIAEPPHLMPADVPDAGGAEVLSALFYPLVEFDADNKPVLAAASAITPDAANQVWTIKLKPGFTFGNGEPVTSQNYLDAWSYGAYGPNGQGGSYFFQRIAGYTEMQSTDPDGDGPRKAPKPEADRLSGVKKIDDLTFTVTLSAPFAGWETVLGDTAFFPLPEAAFTPGGTVRPGFEDHLIGNGPFTMKGSWAHDSQIQVEKAAGFRGPKPKIDGVTFKIYQDPAAEYADLLAGAVDVQTQIPTPDLDAAAGDLGDRVAKSPNSSFADVGFPAYEKQFQDVRVRHALSMAVDRQEMADKIFFGSQTPATSFVSPVVAGYRPDTCGENCEYNPVRAKQLYTAANGPKQITITYNADGGHKAWVDAMCSQMKASLSIDCIGTPVPNIGTELAEIKAKKPVGMVRLGWTMDYPLMENYLGPLYTTDGSSNYCGYHNPAFDDLVQKGAEAKTSDQAVQDWQQAEDILAEDMPVIPLRFGQNVFGHSEHVTDVSVDLFQKVNLYTIQVVR